MDDDLALIKKLEALNQQHEELNRTIDQLNAEKFKDDFQLARLKREKLNLRDEISKLQDAIYPDIIA
jgi:hypothetical protein